MDYLEPPFHFFHPQPEAPFELPVSRFEVGLAQRPITDPPKSIIKPTIRFHLAKPIPSDLFLAVKTGGSTDTRPISPDELEAHPYIDFTNQYLIKRVLAIYDQLITQFFTSPTREGLTVMEATSPQRELPLTLRLTRHGLRIDTRYDVDVVGP